MKIHRDTLIKQLVKQTKKNLNQVQLLKELDDKKLNFKNSPENWSVLECIKHLNIYGDFYTPAIEKSIERASNSDNDYFKTGVLGNYFVKLIEPKEKLNNIKTMSQFNPIGSNLNKAELIKFEQHQYQLLSLLAKASKVNLTTNKTGTSISKLINMRLGDTLRFVVAHNHRHLNQATSIQHSV
jgi:hypothetical protein